jgi:hypothetical protein
VRRPQAAAESSMRGRENAGMCIASNSCFLMSARPVKEKITMEDLSWLRQLQKPPRVDKPIPPAIDRKLRLLKLADGDRGQLSITQKGRIAVRLFG